jgi:hypothetical protein
VDRRRRAGCMGGAGCWEEYPGGICIKDCLNRYILLLLLWPSPLVSLNDIESAQKFMSSIKILKLTRRNGNTGYRRRAYGW